ncbi:MAG: glycosyltransferase family 2 protein [Gemmataceae bacterium]|nr:glycosyltransferase family 2 protein [Gemmataceae bacterium]
MQQLDSAPLRSHTAAAELRDVAIGRPGVDISVPRTVDVSVCIANWNCRDLLCACLASLLHQDQDVRLEVIVVDNASTDGAADLVARDFPQVQLIRNPSNRGFAAANNQAARLARGAHLLFLNNDTVVPARTLGALVEFLDAHPDVIAVGPRLIGTDGRPQTSYRRQPTLAAFLHRTWLFRLTGIMRRSYRDYRRRTSPPLWPCEVDMLLGAALMIDRRRFEDLGGWDEAFLFGGEDLDFSLRARRHGVLVHDPRVTIIHVGRASTKANIGFASPSILAGFARYFRKAGASRRELFLYKLAVTLDAPLQIGVKAVQYPWRRLRGRRRDAAKSWNDLHGAAAFLVRGLVAFWKA